MKKLLSFMVIFLLVGSLSACQIADEMKPLLDSWNLLSGSKQEKDGWLQIGNEGKVNAEHIRELFRQLKTA